MSGAPVRGAVSVTRPHVSALGLGPRPRLRPALEDALFSVEARLGGFARIAGDPQLDLVWRRRSPLAALRETRVEATWNVSPTVVVQLDGRGAASATATPNREAPVRGASMPPAPMRLAIVERRLETRVVGRVREELSEAARRSADVVTPVPVATVATPALSRVESPRRPPLLGAPAPAPAMTLARAPSSGAAAGPTAHETVRTVASAAAMRAPAAAASSPAAPLAIDRITTEVVRALDARVIAWRERMGRS